MALGQVDLALEMLGADPRVDAGTGTGARRGERGRSQGAAGAPPDEKAVHETRKAIKRLRALLRVLRRELGERGFQHENTTLREIAGELSRARDATVMLATLDALIERHPRKLARRQGVLALRRRLAAESATAQRLTLADPHDRARVLGELHAFRWRVSAWSLPADADIRLVAADLERLYRQGRARRRRVLRARRQRTLAMHRWRKRVKDLRHVAEMLDRRGSAGARKGKSSGSGRSRGSGRSDAAATHLRKLAARADELGELLGEEHDLAVLAQHLRDGADARSGLWHTGPRTRKALLELIAKRRRKLRRRALRLGERLYGRKPAGFMRGVRSAYQRRAADA